MEQVVAYVNGVWYILNRVWFILIFPSWSSKSRKIVFYVLHNTFKAIFTLLLLNFSRNEFTCKFIYGVFSSTEKFSIFQKSKQVFFGLDIIPLMSANLYENYFWNGVRPLFLDWSARGFPECLYITEAWNCELNFTKRFNN